MALDELLNLNFLVLKMEAMKSLLHRGVVKLN